MLYTFEPYVLDTQRYELRQQGVPVPLERKAYQVLLYLVQQADRLVTRRELLEAVWPEVYVDDSAVARCIGAVRQAVGDRRDTQRVIRTVHGQGYRFVAPVVAHLGAAGAPPAAPAPPESAQASAPPPGLPAPLVGRAAEVAQLHACWATAQHGGRQLVFVTGEAGIGKTTVVDAFLAQVGAVPPVWIGRGQCIEHYGAGEAYLPLLAALGQLCRAPGGERLVACLRQYAPTWLGHLPAVLPASEYETLQPTIQGATRARMLREVAEVLEALASERLVVLVLEDLHWSDPSTVEALALVARRRDPARLLVLGTYRPVELIVQEHPLKTVKQELVAHGQVVELPLGSLAPEAVRAYLAQRGDLAVEEREGLAAFVYQRTEGHPLFMVQVVDYLAQQGHLRGPTAAEAAGPVEQIVPQGLRELLEAQLGRLGADDQQVLEVGSVVGAEFAVASVAAGMQTTPEAVEAVCEGLARQGQFLEDRGLAEWPDGTVSGRYGFRHALYQEVVYQRLGVWRQARWHRVVGERLEQAYGVRTAEVAAELALHFRRGHDPQRAVQYLGQAAEQALRRSAYQEAIGHLTRGLALLQQLPETAERVHHELDLQLALGPALIATKGSAAPEVEQTYARARALCAQIGETPQRFPTLWGLWRFYHGRGALPTARELGEQLVRLAERATDLTHGLEAHEALGLTLFFLGEYAVARTSLEQGMALTDPTTQRDVLHRHVAVPGVRCLAMAANVLWCLGYPAQALQRAQEALTLAQELADPFSLGLAQHWAATLHYRRREVPAVQAQANALLALATAQGFLLHVGHGTCWQGWALAVQGESVAGLAQLRQGMAAVVATGQEVARPRCLVLIAEAAGHVRQVEEGLRLLAEAQTALEANGQGDLLAEAYRLQGVLLLQQAVPAMAQAEACFQQALTIARRQQAKSWELRAAMSLSRLWQQQGKRAEAYELLTPIYGWFTEGFDTTDLLEVQALLEALA